MGRELTYHASTACQKAAAGKLTNSLVASEVYFLRHYHTCGDEASIFVCYAGFFRRTVMVDKTYGKRLSANDRGTMGSTSSCEILRNPAPTPGAKIFIESKIPPIGYAYIAKERRVWRERRHFGRVRKRRRMCFLFLESYLLSLFLLTNLVLLRDEECSQCVHCTLQLR